MFDATGADLLFLVSRLLFGGVLAFTGLNHFLDVEEMAGYAEFKGIPAPTASVLLSGVLLLLGGLSLIVGVFPALGAVGLALFLLVSAATMHDFWNADGADAQDEFTSFLKNVYGTGAALLFLAVSTVHWPYALNVGL
ncbi:DoxX family membrane protein [Natrialba taiwanensis]|uniref:DoxX family protein n=1 Tax=Natrialba taiwanensis DSM 12281 TaxID=1230458 RepID=M0A1I5_9EURY|nr:DoxX family membrane protein [Natrialba taiwanensis]ELY92605.1 DoxX family protein [Natrialba taiwanensis DSM 12281]